MMLFSQITVFASVPDSSTTSINPEDKLTDELKEVMSNTPDGEYIPIYIWLNDDYSDELVYAHLSNKLGEEINVLNESAYISKRIEEKVEQYKTKQFSTQQRTATISIQSAFENLSVESKISSLRNNADLSSIVTNKEIENCLNDGKSFEYIIELAERYQYLSDYRNSRVAVNKAINKQFESKIENDTTNNLIFDMLLPYVELNCQKEYILEIATMKEVNNIGFLNPSISSFTNEVQFTNNTTNTENIMMPIDTEYTGNGIKIGVLETQAHNSNADHLIGANITKNTDMYAVNLNHSTIILSILCGQKITLNDKEYQGIAPNATVFLARGLTDMNNYYWLIVEKNVAIINISGQTGIGDFYYNSYEKYLDCLVKQYRTVIVNSAGNATYITSPGMGYNLITVGNISNIYDENDRLIVNSASSSFEEESFLTNKPDISAKGTDVRMIYNGEEVNLGTGTSAAAPMVSGTVALMMEANPKLISHPNTVKALLMSTAEQDVVSYNDNDIVSGNPTIIDSSKINASTGILREKSGAGLLNIVQAIKSAVREDYHEYTFATSNNNITTNTYYFEAGDKIEIAMIFDKINDVKLESQYDFDFDIQIVSISYDENGNLIETVFFDSLSTNAVRLNNTDSDDTTAYLPSKINNAELYDIIFNQSGYYRFKIVKKSTGTITTNPTSPFEDATHISHNSTIVSLAVSCGCSNKNITDNYTNHLRTYSCSNCNVQYSEQISKYDITRTVEYGGIECGTVNFKLNYRAGFIDGANAIILNEFSAKANSYDPSAYYFALIVDSGNTEYYPMGYNETVRYELMIMRGSSMTSRFYTVDKTFDYIFDMVAYMSVY